MSLDTAVTTTPMGRSRGLWCEHCNLPSVNVLVWAVEFNSVALRLYTERRCDECQ